MKSFLDYAQLVDVLQARGMHIDDRTAAIHTLEHVSYYRLSGYWYPFRQLQGEHRIDAFYPGTEFSHVMALHTFDAALRAAAFAALSTIELSIRTLLGHGLGAVHACAHLSPHLLGPSATGDAYRRWAARLHSTVASSREDFVSHHRDRYHGVLPVWVAVEVLDWGALTRLYSFSPRAVQEDVACHFRLSAPQLESWLKALNIVRNVCAHHGRLFNRVFALTPKLPHLPLRKELDDCAPFSRCFGLLSLAQFLLEHGGLDRSQALIGALESFPRVPTVALSHLGAPFEWRTCKLWGAGPAEPERGAKARQRGRGVARWGDGDAGGGGGGYACAEAGEGAAAGGAGGGRRG